MAFLCWNPLIAFIWLSISQSPFHWCRKAFLIWPVTSVTFFFFSILPLTYPTPATLPFMVFLETCSLLLLYSLCNCCFLSHGITYSHGISITSYSLCLKVSFRMRWPPFRNSTNPPTFSSPILLTLPCYLLIWNSIYLVITLIIYFWSSPC